MHVISRDDRILPFEDPDLAQVIEAKMQSVGIFVKSQKGRNNEGVVRITIGRPEDNDKVLDNLTL